MVFLLVLSSVASVSGPSSGSEEVRLTLPYYHNSYIHLNITEYNGSDPVGLRAYFFNSGYSYLNAYNDITTGKVTLNVTFEAMGTGRIEIREFSTSIVRYREYLVVEPDSVIPKDIILDKLPEPYNTVTGMVRNASTGEALEGVKVQAAVLDGFRNSYSASNITGSDGRYTLEIQNSTRDSIFIYASGVPGYLNSEYRFFSRPDTRQYNIDLDLVPIFTPEYDTRVRYLDDAGEVLDTNGVSIYSYLERSAHRSMYLSPQGPDMDGWYTFNNSLGELEISMYTTSSEYNDLSLTLYSNFVQNYTERDYEITVDLTDWVETGVNVWNQTHPLSSSYLQLYHHGTLSIGRFDMQYSFGADPNGTFHFFLPPGSEVPVWISAGGHHGKQIMIETGTEGPIEINVTLEEMVQPGKVETTLLNIEVIDENSGLPVRYADITGVRVDNNDVDYLDVTADENGRWSGMAKVGTYTRFFSIEGIGTGEVPDVILREDETRNITILLKRRPVEDQDAGELHHFYTVDENDEPVPGAQVRMWVNQYGGSFYNTVFQSDHEGRIDLMAVPGSEVEIVPEYYTTSSALDPWVYRYSLIDLDPMSRRLPDLVVYPREELQPITGFIRDSSDMSPVSQARITCQSVKVVEEDPTRMKMMNGHEYFNDGPEYFHMERYSESGGFYRVWGVQTAIIGVTMDGYFPHEERIDMVPTRDIEGKDILLDPLPEVFVWMNGTLVDENGDPVSGSLNITDLDHPAVEPVLVDVNGTGEFHVLLYEGSFHIMFNNETMEGNMDIELGPDGIEDLVLQLIPMSEIAGRVVDWEGTPLEGINVTLWEGNSTIAWFMTGSDGEFSFMVPWGNYHIYIAPSELYEAHSVNDIFVDGWQDWYNTLYLNNRTFADVQGVVFGSGGPYAEGVPGTSVYLMEDDAQRYSAEADASGSFLFRDVAYGIYDLKAVPPGNLAPVVGIRSGYRSNTTFNLTVSGYLVTADIHLDYEFHAPPGYVNVTFNSPQGEGVYLDEPIFIEFSEVMNTSAVERSVTISPGVLNPVFQWDEWGYTVRMDHDPFLPDTTYTVTVGSGAVSYEGWPFWNGTLSWEFTTGNTTDPWMITEAEVYLDDMDLVVEVGAPSTLVIYIGIENVGYFLLEEEFTGIYTLRIHSSEFEYETTYGYYFTDEFNGYDRAPEFSGIFTTPGAPVIPVEWEIFQVQITIDNDGEWSVWVRANPDLTIYIIIRDVGSFLLGETSEGEYEMTIDGDLFEKGEEYHYYFSETEDGGETEDSFPGTRTIPADISSSTNFSLWQCCLLSGGIAILLILIVFVIIIVVKRRKGEDGGWEE